MSETDQKTIEYRFPVEQYRQEQTSGPGTQRHRR